MNELKNIKKTDAGTIREQILKDAEDAGDAVSYIKDAAEHGCIGGNCYNLVYYTDTHAFYAKYADEIDELLDNCDVSPVLEDSDGRIKGGDLRNFLVWWAYETQAQEIMSELEDWRRRNKI